MTDPKQTDPIEAACIAAALADDPCYKWSEYPEPDKAMCRVLMSAALSAYRDAEIEALRAQVKELQNDLERERMRLAACSTAALGYFEEPCNDEYRSAALGDVLAIRSKLADALSVIKSRGHAADCHVNACAQCTMASWQYPHGSRAHHNFHEFQPGPCSEACGYSRCVGVE